MTYGKIFSQGGLALPEVAVGGEFSPEKFCSGCVGCWGEEALYSIEKRQGCETLPHEEAPSKDGGGFTGERFTPAAAAASCKAQMRKVCLAEMLPNSLMA